MTLFLFHNRFFCGKIKFNPSDVRDKEKVMYKTQAFWAAYSEMPAERDAKREMDRAMRQRSRD